MAEHKLQGSQWARQIERHWPGCRLSRQRSEEVPDGSTSDPTAQKFNFWRAPVVVLP